MGAYNWLEAGVRCFSCSRETKARLQIRIGWCRYQEYSIGESIAWMTPEERTWAEKYTEASDCAPLRVLIEVGSPDWHDFAISTGDYQCPYCHAEGTVLAIVRDNIFQSVIFSSTHLMYGEVLLSTQLYNFEREQEEQRNK